MPVVRQRGLTLHYLVRGSGEAVLLIHGIASSGADWAFQAPALESRFLVIAPDLPGNGHSSPPPAGFSVHGCAELLWSLLDELRVQAVNIVGFSFGGAVALEMALQRPGSVSRLVLINSLVSYRLDSWRKWLEARVPPVLVRTLGMRRVGRLVAARVFPRPWQRPMRERAVAVIGEAPSATYLGMAKALERWSASDRLHRLECRVLMIAAEHDYTPLAEKRHMAARLGAELVVVRGSRHGTPFDSIGLTNAALLEFLCDRPLPPPERRVLDEPELAPVAPPPGSLVEQHAAAGRSSREY